ncbi:pantothenate synthetase [Roseibium hamelinense]|uniref:Pantothenate synthetase n=1 Tax=Roseibium hamelinense TaxID=150831 RepID=A0A562T1W3_9HYPH|nr:pantoate--beta-alanine ligase [Roseibium hamelinense]MTI43772.1 pantoate--beta-alanine ligase [Roseibium hamelinense]TWI87148.1 pantothenate synthetase [Roseibium hamelinense]
MEVCSTKGAIRGLVRNWRKSGNSLGLVPTMGYLHEGHLALVRRARSETDRVVTSIFVNPTQFGPNEDLQTYPRDEKRDLALLEAEGVDAVFMPDVEEMYGAAGDTFVEVPGLSARLQGALRPGHFRGVTTVVTKLFNIVQPDVAVFGEKDYQQLTIIRQMVKDLDVPLRIVGQPTVREPDGLALSSRNVRLAAKHRQQATALSKSLAVAANMAKPQLRVAEMEREIRTILEEAPDAEIKSVDILDATTLEPMPDILDRDAVILLAVRFGSVLLIDQKVIHVERYAREI